MKRQLSVMTVMVAVFILSGCSTSKEELLPPGEQSMLEIWQGKGSGGHSRHMTAARD
ncbi:TIGR03751 family conjugal transfer lipoprotein, partial [Escherichia coli]|nr:TIGR03751 family conjugal transfer lipoprotein [Escherichia coli]